MDGKSAVERYAGGRRSTRPDDARGEYKAFAADRTEKGALEALEIRMLQHQAEVIYYSYITRFHYNGEESITLRGMDFQAQIEGEGLGELVRLLKRRECDFVQVFDPHRFHEPAEGEPIIRSIQVRGLFDGSVAYGGNA